MESTSLTKAIKWGAISAVIVILLFLVAAFFDMIMPFELVGHLLFGGFWHLFTSIPHMVPSLSTIMGFAALLTLSVCALQVLLAKFAKSKEGSGLRWRPRWTLAVVGLVLASIGTACATVGLAHHATWLFRAGITHFDGGISPVTKSISNGRQLVTAMRIYSSDHGGEYPKHLEDLVREGILDQEGFVKINRMIGHDGLPTPWVFLPGLSDADSGDLPLIIGSCPVFRDTYILGLNDSRVIAVKRQEFEEAMARYRKFVGIEDAGRNAATPGSQQNRELTPPASVP